MLSAAASRAAGCSVSVKRPSVLPSAPRPTRGGSRVSRGSEVRASLGTEWYAQEDPTHHHQHNQHHQPLPPHRQRSHTRRSVAAHVKEGETAEQALERRMRESERVRERVIYIEDAVEWEAELKKAGSNLVVLEIQSQLVCQSGLDEEAELHWRGDQKAALARCSGLKHSFARVARECQDAVFLSLDVGDDKGSELCNMLGVDTLPTLQFWRNGQKLWEHRGVVQLDQGLGEGVLYYGDTAANNVRASTFVTDLHSRSDLEGFVNSQSEDMLTVVDVSLLTAAPCIHVFPAVLSLATNFQGYAAFSRLVGDDAPELLQELNIQQVPTFLFYRGGKEVGRHVGSSRADLIGQILAQQAKHGIQPPPPRAAAPPAATGNVQPTRRGRFAAMMQGAEQ